MLLALAAVVYIGFQVINVPDDIFWHVRMGADFFKEGFKAFHDHYSFTLPDHPVMITALPFDLLASGFFSQFGYPGLQLLRVVFWASTLTCLIWVFRSYNYSLGLQILGASFIVFAMVERYLIRPELVGFPFQIQDKYFDLNRF